MTIYEGHRLISDELLHIYSPRESENIAALVLEKITGLGRMERTLNKNQSISEEHEALLIDYTQQLKQHRPVQYILQEAWFYGMALYVDENVLIPRPETEELAEWILKDIKSERYFRNNQPRILDIGTGSGCIAIALKKNLPDSDVSAIDISSKALEVAQKNAQRMDCHIRFSTLDILNAVQSSVLPQFDIIVSNPPYIPLKDKAEMHQNVLHYEPHTALFVENNNPLLFYSAIAGFAQLHLQPNGWIYTEIHENMGEEVKDVFLHEGFTNTTIRKDMQGKNRMIKAGKSNLH